MQELSNLQYQIYRDRKERRIELIKFAFDLYSEALARQEAEARKKRPWWQRLLKGESAAF